MREDERTYFSLVIRKITSSRPQPKGKSGKTRHKNGMLRTRQVMPTFACQSRGRSECPASLFAPCPTSGTVLYQCTPASHQVRHHFALGFYAHSIFIPLPFHSHSRPSKSLEYSPFGRTGDTEKVGGHLMVDMPLASAKAAMACVVAHEAPHGLRPCAPIARFCPRRKKPIMGGGEHEVHKSRTWSGGHMRMA
jgi:hypothetical protein